MTAGDDRIPVTLVTGFLGSGKTTLLNRLLGAPGGERLAVLVNELGEVGLDHDLLVRVDDATAVLQGGCVCCALRGDLATALRGLCRRRDRGEVPAFTRLVVETTGLADPAPILHLLLTEPLLCHRFRLGGVVTTVDALHCASTLGRPECTRQIAAADQLLITKDDLADAAALAAIEVRLEDLNPTAALWRVHRDRPDTGALLRDAAVDSAELRRWAKNEEEHAHRHTRDAAQRHLEGIAAVSLVLDAPLDWSAFGVWLTMLLHRHGPKVLRVKGLLNVAGADAPLLVQCVQETIHRPVHLAGWPSADHRSRLVLIVDGLSRGRLLDSLAAFNRLGRPGADARFAPAA